MSSKTSRIYEVKRYNAVSRYTARTNETSRARSRTHEVKIISYRILCFFFFFRMKIVFDLCNMKISVIKNKNIILLDNLCASDIK